MIYPLWNQVGGLQMIHHTTAKSRLFIVSYYTSAQEIQALELVLIVHLEMDQRNFFKRPHNSVG